jgi:hypothetical protein
LVERAKEKRVGRERAGASGGTLISSITARMRSRNHKSAPSSAQLRKEGDL